MHEIHFCYQLNDNDWHESNTEIAAADISSVPIILVMNYSHERTREKWRKAWCEEHQAYEDIASSGENSLTTASGCQLTGLIAKISVSIYNTSNNYDFPRIDKYIRCHLLHDPSEDSVHLIDDNIEVFCTWQKQADETYLPIPRTILRNSYSKTFNIGSQEQPEHIYSPSGIVLERLMSVLHEKARHIYGDDIRLLLPPSDSVGYDNRWRDYHQCEWLLALLHRPLDMNIYFFRKYFRDNKKFNELFPRNQRHNFAILAETLGLTPTEELKHDYEKNPLSLIFHLMLPELGIKDKHLISKFFSLHAFCGHTMEEDYKQRLFFDPLKVGPKDYMPDEDPAEYDNLRFYCLWRREHESEEELANYLLEKQQNWRNWKYTALRAFHKCFDHLTDELKEEILKNGLSLQAYYQLMILWQHCSCKESNYFQGEKKLARECRINDYNFRLIPSIDIFRSIIHPFMLRVLDYREYIGKTFYAIERNGRYIGAMILNGHTVEQESIVDDYDDLLQAKGHIAYLAWVRHHHLERKYFGRDECEDAMQQEFIIEPLKHDKWDSMSLMEMLELPETEISPGFYLSLNMKLTETFLLRPPAPSLSDDEQEYLQKNLPWGKRLFQAAFAGNPEAQYAMSLFYRDHHCSAADRCLAEEWYLRAVSNGWLEIAPAKKDVRIFN